jgi:hypothetical protein
MEMDRQKENGVDPLEGDVPVTRFDLSSPSPADESDVGTSEANMQGERDTASLDADSTSAEETVAEPAEPLKTGAEYFKKRAVNEVSGLQMVEHVFTGVEREYMKVVPKPFDDFNAKKALHTFVNIAAETGSDEYKAAEQALMQETEAWGMALTERDRNIAVSNLRRYCENSRPALSSQALLALARFYRNSPCSESVRAKFDFVITRLFSRPVQDEKRVCLFQRAEMVKHINTLYNEWSSVPLYAADEDESNVLLTGLSFDELAVEAEAAANFDQLTGSDFFGRVRLFKESISELFFAPTVTAAAIESNIRIGNAYVHLIDTERRKMDASSIESRYGSYDLQDVSDTTGRTFDLAELVRQRELEVEARALAVSDPADGSPKTKTAGTAVLSDPGTKSWVAAKVVEGSRRVNRWLLITAVLMVFLTIGLYVWSDFLVVEKVSTVGVKKVDMEFTPMGEYVQTARISGETFYGLMLPTWDTLSKEKREEVLKKILDAGKDKGYKQVTLINKDGKQAAFASANRMEVMTP